MLHEAHDPSRPRVRKRELLDSGDAFAGVSQRHQNPIVPWPGPAFPGGFRGLRDQDRGPADSLSRLTGPPGRLQGP